MTLSFPLMNLRPATRRAFAVNKPLTIAGLFFVLAFVGTLVGIAVDPTVITGMPAWVKPAKFMISSAIYAFTLIWMLGFVQGHRRLVAAAGWISAIALLAENAGILVQVARGTTSHFNIATPFDTAIWGMMSAMTVGLWGGCFLVGVALLVQRLPERTVAWALRLGVLLALVGMAFAFFMPIPKPDQLAAAQAGGGLTVVGAHTVGRPDGGPGLPILGWSTVSGDLRIAHFVGLHGLQVLPLLALFVTRRLRFLHTETQTALIVVAGLCYLGLVLLLAWQALRGQSIVAPDALTLGAVAGLVATTTLAIFITLWQGRTTPTPVMATGQ